MFVDCYDLEKIKNCFSALWATFSFYQNGGENIAVRPRMQFLQETLYKLPVLKMIFYWWKNKRKEKQLIFWWSGYVFIYQDGDEDHWFYRKWKGHSPSKGFSRFWGGGRCVLSLGVMVALHFRKVWVLWKWLVMRVRFGGKLWEREVATNFFILVWWFWISIGGLILKLFMNICLMG